MCIWLLVTAGLTCTPYLGGVGGESGISPSSTNGGHVKEMGGWKAGPWKMYSGSASLGWRRYYHELLLNSGPGPDPPCASSQDPARGHGGGWQHLFGGDVRRDQARPRAPESGETEPQANWVSEFLHHVPLICWISLTKLRFWDCDCRALNLKRGVPLWAPGSVWLCRSQGPEPAQVIISWGFREILQGSHFYSHSATEETKALCSLCQALGKQR